MAAHGMFQWLSNVLEDDVDLMVDAEAIKSYDPRTMTRWLVQYEDCILIASEANRIALDDKRMHYDFLRTSIRKRKRYVKWVKKEKPDPRIAVLMEYYNIGQTHAEDYLKVLTDDQINILSARMDKGGNARATAKQKKK